MNDVWLALTSALGGGLVASITSIVVLTVQNRAEDRRKRQEFALQIALAERQEHIQIVNNKGGIVPPPYVYLVMYQKVLDQMSRGDLTAKHIARIGAEVRKLSREIEKVAPRTTDTTHPGSDNG